MNLVAKMVRGLVLGAICASFFSACATNPNRPPDPGTKRWYEQRISVEKNRDAKKIMQNAQQEEFKHFGMDLEFLLRQMPKWRKELKTILFTTGDIVELGEKAEESVD